MDGEHVWSRDFGDMTTRATFGEGSSPTIVDDMILVPWDHEGPSALYALNKLTGETIWKADRDEPTCWATPLVVEHAGRRQIVMNGQNYARAYDLETGREIWRCGGQTDRPIASAVAADGIVFVGSGYRGAFLGAFLPNGKGDIAGTDSVVWTVNQGTPDIASPLLSGNRLYYHSGKLGIITCVDAETGRVHFNSGRIRGLEQQVYASPIAAGGYVYMTDRSGTTVVIRDSNQFEVVATNTVGETVDATPAPVDQELFIRGERHLFCITEE
jgi:outer membrane protein assembly factor BamB